MTRPDIAAVPTLAGRELDAALHTALTGKPVCLHQKTTLVKPGLSRLRMCDDCGRSFGDTTYAMACSEVPHYSTSYEHLEAMIKAVRAMPKFKDRRAAVVRMEHTYGQWHVELWDKHGVRYRSEGSTLPLAFARAALAAALTMEM